MIKKQEYILQITYALALLAKAVEFRSSINLYDINIGAEDFYRDFLNLSLGYNLENINAIDPNAASIDLGDSQNRIAIQVTSTSAIAKTRNTVNKFIEKQLFKQYDRLMILNIVKATKHSVGKIGEAGKYELDTQNDILDYNDLVRKINHKSTDSLKAIASFLKKELRLNPATNHSKEINTIATLIDHLSNLDNLGSSDSYIEDPDPEGKIFNRFAAHSKFLTEEYVQLYEVYGPNLEEAKKTMDIGTVQVTKMSLHLKSYSDQVLNDCGGNPKDALHKIQDELSAVIKSKGIDYDATAIRFFIINELIRCNVFPNMESVNV